MREKPATDWVLGPAVTPAERRRILDELVDRLRKGEEIPPELAAPASDMLEQALQNPLDSVGQVFGITCHGGLQPHRRDELETRNGLLRALWQTHETWKSLPPRAAASMMSRDAERYQETRWKREQQRRDAPLSEPAATWWRIIKQGQKIPGVKRLTDILADGNTPFAQPAPSFDPLHGPGELPLEQEGLLPQVSGKAGNPIPPLDFHGGDSC